MTMDIDEWWFPNDNYLADRLIQYSLFPFDLNESQYVKNLHCHHVIIDQNIGSIAKKCTLFSENPDVLRNHILLWKFSQLSFHELMSCFIRLEVDCLQQNNKLYKTLEKIFSYYYFKITITEPFVIDLHFGNDLTNINSIINISYNYSCANTTNTKKQYIENTFSKKIIRLYSPDDY